MVYIAMSADGLWIAESVDGQSQQDLQMVYIVRSAYIIWSIKQGLQMVYIARCFINISLHIIIISNAI